MGCLCFQIKLTDRPFDNWSEPRRNISIGIPLDLSIPTEMTSIEPLVENEKSSKTQKKLKFMLCYIF